MEDIDLNLLVSLDALLQESSVTAAAKRLGLSTPAMSHALARIRGRLGDPILVRSGRGMVLTPRGVALRTQVHDTVQAARQALQPQRPFVPAELQQTFVIHASDYVLSVLGVELDRTLRREAPHVGLRFVPNTPDDAAQLRDNGSDLAVGIYGALPPDLRTRQLLTDRFVCVVRQGHPIGAQRLTLDSYVALPHVQVAPRGQPGGYVDDMLAARGLTRKVARAVPYFVTALQLVAETDYVLTVSERIARRYAQALGLQVLETPLALQPYALSLVWPPRLDADPGHRWLREVFVRIAEIVAGERHQGARTRLDRTDPTAGAPRKRPPTAR